MKKYVGGIELLSDTIRQELARFLQPDDKIFYCVSPCSTVPNILEILFLNDLSLVRFFRDQTTNWLDGAVALDNRIIFFHESTSPGPPVIIEYLDIKSIGVSNRAINISVLSVNGHALTMPGRAYDEIQIFSEWLREKVRQIRLPVETQKNSLPSPSLVIELERLANLYKSGALSATEFEAAKKKLLELRP